MGRYMLLRDLKLLFDAGTLRSAKIVPANNDYWNLKVEMKEDKDDLVMSSQRADKRIFKTIDAAYSAAVSIGFKEVRILSRDDRA